MGNRPFDQPASNSHFQLALTLTAVNGHSEIFSMLLAAGSRIDASDNDGNSSLDLAIAYGEPKCSMVLEIIELEALVPKASLATPETQCPLGARLRLSSRPRRAIPRKTAFHATPQPSAPPRGSKTLTPSFTRDTSRRNASLIEQLLQPRNPQPATRNPTLPAQHAHLLAGWS